MCISSSGITIFCCLPLSALLFINSSFSYLYLVYCPFFHCEMCSMLLFNSLISSAIACCSLINYFVFSDSLLYVLNSCLMSSYSLATLSSILLLSVVYALSWGSYLYSNCNGPSKWNRLPLGNTTS